MVGLFDSLRDLTQNVGKLVSIVGDRLDDSRGDVVRIASDVDTQVPFSLNKFYNKLNNTQIKFSHVKMK